MYGNRPTVEYSQLPRTYFCDLIPALPGPDCNREFNFVENHTTKGGNARPAFMGRLMYLRERRRNCLFGGVLINA